jgi:ER-Golgi trafficking TRAPP I complex 85 kDa subunit
MPRGGFAAAAAARYVPTVGVHATRECDTVVRMSGAAAADSLHAALAAAADRAPPMRLATPAELGPHVWLEASMALDAALRGCAAGDSPQQMLDSYTAALEDATTNVEHEFLAQPLLSALGVWVGEQDILPHLDAVTPREFTVVGGCGGASPAPASVAERPPTCVVVLVARAGSRQDDAALLDAKAAVSTRVPAERVFVLRLGDGVPADDPESLPSAVATIGEAARGALALRLKEVSAEADRARRAVRPSLRSWFGMMPAPKPLPLLVASGSSRMSFGGAFEAQGRGDEASGATEGSQPSLYAARSPASSRAGGGVARRVASPGGRHRRRTSSMNGVISTPLYPADSTESLSRHAADLLMLSGDYEAAGDAYRVLATDVAGQAGAASVHEASAIEHASVALALADGSKREVGSGLERAVKLYAQAGRRELAVRAALRAAEYCVEAGFPESAAGVLDRALSVAFPSAGVARVAAAGSFSESASAVLLARTALMFVLMGRRRKASLYAYLAAAKLSNQMLHAAAGIIACNVDESAIAWPGIGDEVELFFGRAFLAQGKVDRAEAHFSGVMANARESTDVEVQSRAILGFFDAVSKTTGAGGVQRRWDGGAMFPISDMSQACVTTVDSQKHGEDEDWVLMDEGVVPFTEGSTRESAGKDDVNADDTAMSWSSLEEEILRDCEHFNNVRAAREAGKSIPKRPRSFQSVAEELRQEKEKGSGVDPGGSLEMKLQRMRETAAAEMRRLRANSLLDSGAVVGEALTLHLTLRNPLQFPVFVEAASPVVTLDGRVVAANNCEDNLTEDELCPDVTFAPVGDILIMPSSSKQIELQAVAHKVGDLTFIGAQWMFSIGRSASPQDGNAMAAGFCVLERRGPRLNDTRQQRASEVPLYAEDETLKLHVIAPAPRLVVRFVNRYLREEIPPRRTTSDGDEDECDDVAAGLMRLRAGQKLCLELAITNTGQGPVDRIVYRTGTPHAFYLDTIPGDDFESLEQEGENRNAATTANVAGCMALSLKPGETAHKPVWLFGSTDGDTEIRLAIGYGDRVRICRSSCRLNILPSVNVFPRFIRRMLAPAAECDSPASPNSFLLGIEVEHAGKCQGDDSYLVESAAVCSLVGWTVRKLPTAVVPEGSGSLHRKANRPALRINETSTVFLVVSLPTEVPECLSTAPLQVSSVSFAQDEIEGTHAREVCLKDGVSRASTHFLLSSGHAGKIGSTHAETAVHLSVKWKNSSGDVGELYVPPLDPSEWVDYTISKGPPKEPALELENLDAAGAAVETPADLPVEVRVAHRKHMSHRFFYADGADLASVPAVVPVDFYIRNVSDVLIDTCVLAPVAGGIADGDRGRFWAGLVDVKLRAISPGIERRVCFSAILDSPGTYDLSKLVTNVHRHRGLTPSEDISTLSRMFSREVRVHDIVASSIVVDDVPGVTTLPSNQSRSPTKHVPAASVARKQLVSALDSVWDAGESDGDDSL